MKMNWRPERVAFVDFRDAERATAYNSQPVRQAFKHSHRMRCSFDMRGRVASAAEQAHARGIC